MKAANKMTMSASDAREIVAAGLKNTVLKPGFSTWANFVITNMEMTATGQLIVHMVPAPGKNK